MSTSMLIHKPTRETIHVSEPMSIQVPAYAPKISYQYKSSNVCRDICRQIQHANEFAWFSRQNCKKHCRPKEWRNEWLTWTNERTTFWMAERAWLKNENDWTTGWLTIYKWMIEKPWVLISLKVKTADPSKNTHQKNPSQRTCLSHSRFEVSHKSCSVSKTNMHQRQKPLSK